jgi:methylmalonyl-CoA mutase
LQGFASAFPVFPEADWLRAVEASLKGGSRDALVSKTSDGIALGPLHGRREGLRAARGVAGAWAVVARADHPEAGDANAQALEDLGNGADGLQVVFAGAAGACGFGLASWDSAHLHRAFDGVRFDEGVRIELDLGPEAAAQARAVAGLVIRSGASLAEVELGFGLDPIGALARSGRGARSWDEEARALTKLVLELRGEGLRGPFFAADGRPVHAAGGTPAQELAFTLASGVSYLRALEQGGLPLEAAWAAIAFRMAADADEFVTLSKFRALRLLWARIGEACGLPPLATRVHAESAWRMMTARDPYVNVMRGAMAAFAAGLGGADSVSLLPLTQAIGLPDAFARRLARNTQLIQLRESHLGFVADPAAGAGAFEALTRGLCETAWALFQATEAEGGLPRALLSGAFQGKVAEAAATLSRDAARMKTPITGVSAHPDILEIAVDVLPASPASFEFPGEAVAPPLRPMRVAEPFERLRGAADAIAATEGARPSIFLAAIGPAAAHSRRVGFARDLFEAGGFSTLADSGDASAESSAARFVASGSRLACLCGADEAYEALAEAYARELKRAGARQVWLAGKPRDREAAWRAAGIDGFIFAGCDAVEANAIGLRILGGAV